MDIKCRKTECKYNDKFVCGAKKIDVDNTHVCKTFELGNEKAPDTTKLIFLKRVEYAPFRHCKNLFIECKEKCLFNDGGQCKANGILINVQKEAPKCLGKELVYKI